jgi:hypothetical protein
MLSAAAIPPLVVVVRSSHILIVIPAKHGGAVREPGSSKR